jgi:hypothetical protein
MFGDADEDYVPPPDPLVQRALGLIAVGVVVCGLVLTAVVLMAPGVFAEWGMGLSGEYDIPCVQGMTIEAAEQYVGNYDPPLKPFRIGEIERRKVANSPGAVVLSQGSACGADAEKPTAVNVVVATPSSRG